MASGVWVLRKSSFLCLIPVIALILLIWKVGLFCQTEGREESQRLLKELSILQQRVARLQDGMKYNQGRSTRNEPVIYAITPTYARYTQKAELTRLLQTLMHVENFHWIIVEDALEPSSLVQNLLAHTSIRHTLLHVKTRDILKSTSGPRWKTHRGVDQRNAGLQWIRKHVVESAGGVVYFADDDNTYSLEVFKEAYGSLQKRKRKRKLTTWPAHLVMLPAPGDNMRSTKKVSMWPVALVGGLRWEGPICQDGKVREFFTAWKPERTFPMDMAGFAFHTKLLFQYPDAAIDAYSKRGFLETDFLAKALHLSKEDVEAKADNCRKILVWHTRTAAPDMKHESRLNRHGAGSDTTIEI